MKLSPISPSLEAWYLRGYFLFAVTAYMTWAVRVIDAICAFLDINCLTIKKRKTDENSYGTANGELKPKTPRAKQIEIENSSDVDGGLRRSTRKKA